MEKSKLSILISIFTGFIALTFTFLVLTNEILIFGSQKQIAIIQSQNNQESNQNSDNLDDYEDEIEFIEKSIVRKDMYLDVSEESWTLADNNETIISNNDDEFLPIISITLENEDLTKEYETCQISVISGIEKYDINMAEAQIKVRGNSSSNYTKKPFRIKFDKKQVMLGLNNDLKAKSWVLLTEYRDLTMMKNATALYLGKQILGEDGYYVSDFRFVDVFINNYYQGVYLLAEQQQANKNRININEPEKDYEECDIGYLLELDAYYIEENNYFGIEYGKLIDVYGSIINEHKFNNHYVIKSDLFSDKQLSFIQNYLQNIWNIMYNATQRDLSDNSSFLTMDEDYELIEDDEIASAKEAIEKYVDINSLVDTFILNEICINFDIGWSSFYMSVDLSENSKKLTFEAPWDFDIAFNSRTDIDIDDFYTCKKNNHIKTRDIMNPWLVILSSQDWFMEMVKERWTEVGTGLIENAILKINNYMELYSEFFERNFNIWYEINCTLDSQRYAINNLIEFLEQRKIFMDNKFLIGE